MKNKKIIGILSVVYLLFSLTGCSPKEKGVTVLKSGVVGKAKGNKGVAVSSKFKENKDGSYTLKFKDMIAVEDLKTLDGKKVKLTGFVSTASPLHGKYIYLLNIPYQSCPFCVPNDKTLTNSMAVYAQEGKSFKFMDVPVTVEGELDFGGTEDEMGYSYNYRIIDGKIEKADIANMEKEIKIYTELIDKGFALNFNKVMGELSRAIQNSRQDSTKKRCKGNIIRNYKRNERYV